MCVIGRPRCGCSAPGNTRDDVVWKWNIKWRPMLSLRAPRPELRHSRALDRRRSQHHDALGPIRSPAARVGIEIRDVDDPVVRSDVDPVQ
jgi:hypothetical protein